MLSLDHVIILYKSKPGTCKHCVEVTNIWDNPPPKSIDGLSISAALKKVNPKVRFVTVTANDNQGHFDENLTPKDLIRYGVRFPQIILIPGKLWDEAMNNLGSNNNVKLVDGVKVMNYKMSSNEKLIYDGQYNIKVPSDYEKWYRSCIEEETKEINNKPEINKPEIISNKNNILGETLPQKTSSPKTKQEYNMTVFNDVCAVRLVSKTNK